MKEHKLVTIGKEKFAAPDRTHIHFLDDKNANNLMNDLENYPHAFVLACLMDRQMKAERAWMIPYQILNIIGSFNMDVLLSISMERYKSLFIENSFHRFNDTMAELFYLAIHDIQTKYAGNVSKIWSNEPSSAKVVYEFLQFKGCGIKIATMAANILARQFKIPFSDYYSIDISPDIHIQRVMKRIGLVEKNADLNSIIYKARELNPEFPGIIDFSCWEIGRKWCKPKLPNCEECEIKDQCQKIID